MWNALLVLPIFTPEDFARDLEGVAAISQETCWYKMRFRVLHDENPDVSRWVGPTYTQYSFFRR